MSSEIEYTWGVHLPDGYLSPGTCAALTAAMLPAWGVSAARLRKCLGTRRVPELALGSAFSFVVMMFNVPAPGGTTGHAVGAGLVALLAGPEAAVVTTSVALAIQALVFADGGLLAFGANCFNMALVLPLATYAVYRLLAAGDASPGRKAAAAAIGAYLGLNLAALATAVELGLQPALAHDEQGVALYCPFDLATTVPAMLSVHLLVFGFIEAIATAGVIGWAATQGLTFDAPAKERRFTPLWIGLGALILLSPVGLVAGTIGFGDAWGEWDAEGVADRNHGVVPTGLARLAELWKGLLPDYALPGHDSGPLLVVGYVVSAVLGCALVAAIAWGLGRLFAAPEPATPAPPASS